MSTSPDEDAAGRAFAAALFSRTDSSTSTGDADETVPPPGSSDDPVLDEDDAWAIARRLFSHSNPN